MTFEITVLGSNGALPAHDRHPTAQILNHNESFYLIDCGEGTQMRLDDLNIRRSKINHIFISHLHGDHYYGLMGLLTSYILLGRQQKLTIFSPPGLQQIIDVHMDIKDPKNGFEIDLIELEEREEPQSCFANQVLEVFYFPLQHRITCYGYFFKEVKQKRNVIKSKSSYAYCTDTLPVVQQYDLLKNSNLLYHEATFMHDDVERAAETHHTTTIQAAEVAQALSAKQLLIGHYSAKYKNLEPLLEEAKSVFTNTDLAIEGEKFRVEY